MDVNTHLEDLSNEIFFEIFDYLHIFDIFTGFTLLNRRISSILQSIPLHIVISKKHCRRQIDFLSSQLTFHEHQVISINISDIIRDDSSIISLLFNRHNFSHLKSCKLMSIDSMTTLGNVIEQIQSLNTLVLLQIFQPNYENITKNDNDQLTQTILTHKSSSLRSNVTSLNLRITGSPSTVSIYSVLRVFRLCHRIRYLCIILQHDKRFENNNVNVPSDEPLTNENDLPILSQLTSFELSLDAIFDIWLISYILRCMPILKHFYFHLMPQKSLWPFTDQYLDGNVWKEMFEQYLPCLSKFEFYMVVLKRLPKLDLNFVVESFNYFVNKYSNWDMIIDRWKYDFRVEKEYIIVRTLNCSKRISIAKLHVPFLFCETFETQSTRKTIDDHYSFYSDITNLKLYINERSNVTWSSPLFQHITYLLVEIPIIKSWWNYLFNIVNFRRTIDDNRNASQNLTYLSCFVHLWNVKKLEFRSSFHADRWKDVQLILQACPNVDSLIINTPLLVLSKLIDNSFLIPIFKQIKMIKSITEDIYFPSAFVSKFVQRFPSLCHIELQVFSFDNCSFIIDIFLTELKQISYLKINYDDTYFDDPFSCEYIIIKRRQAFPLDIINEQMVNVKNNGEVIEIWLS
ncbi:unnamed protein product [Rotaria sordida]|uniref:F-box domain-containing protein n=1 Tax=Rotaria sordida TaxID=392033 RepID=A0A819HRY4_9BILA|nr:unnamed protein product [Rotaria sordida]